MSRRKRVLALAVSMAVVGGHKVWANNDNIWVGGTSTNYNDPTNWSLGHLPDNTQTEDAVINTATGNVPLISADVPINPIDMFIGRGIGSSGVLNQSAGTVGNNGWAFIGADGATGTWNLGDTTTTGGTFSGLGLGSGSIQDGGRLYVGGRQINTGGVGTFNVNTSGTINVGNDMPIGASNGTGTVNLDAGSVTVGGWMMMGSDHNGNSANGTLNMSGGSITMSNTGGVFVAGLNGSTGHMTMTGGTLTSNSEIWFGQGFGDGHQGSGTANITNAIVNANNWVTVGRNGGWGHLTLGGNTQFIKVNPTTNITNINIGEADGSVGVVDVQGNALFSTDHDLNIALGGNGNGTVNQFSGTVRVSNNLNIQQSGTGAYNLSGGKLFVNGAINNTNGGSFNFTGGTLTRNNNAAPLNYNGNLSPGGKAATLGLDNGKTITLSGALNVDPGFTLDLTGDSIPSTTGSSGSIPLGTVGSQLGTFDTVNNPIVGLSNPGGATYIDETAGESHAFSSSDKVFWIQNTAGALSLNYSIAAATPEPMSFGAVALGATGLLARRRRKR